MIYKFKVWAWLPMTTEVYLSASKDEEAVKMFKNLDLKLFNWKDDGLRQSRATYELENVQNGNKSSGSTRNQKKES